MKKTVFILSILFFLAGCKKDFLQQEPTDALSDNIAFISKEDIRLGLNGCYYGMTSTNYYGKNFIIYPEITADNFKINEKRTTGRFFSDYNYFLKPSTAEVKDLWSIGYRIIYRTNRVIKAIPTIKYTTEIDKNNDLGEALAIRALVHFDLVRAYAQPYNYTSDASHLGIPVILETNTNLSPIRNTVAEVYTQIVSDLTLADSLINTTSSTFLSKNGVKGLLAKVNLYKENWTSALKYSKCVIDSSLHVLTPNNDYAASWIKETNSESIFELAYTSTENLIQNSIGYELLNGGYGDIIPTKDIMNVYSLNDVRKQWFDTLENSAYCIKYPGRNGSIGLDNIKVLRLSEMYLIAAEALAEIGDDAEALKYLNVILKRADITAADITGVSGTNLKDLIQLERRKELAFEGNRLFDLTRRKQGVVRIDFNPGSANNGVTNYPYDHFIMPIPQREMDVNKNLIQNTGY